MPREARFFMTVALLGLVPLTPTFAQPVLLSGWVPNNGNVAVGESFVGDLYTFECPPGGDFDVSVDTRDDGDNSTSNVDLKLEIRDRAGLLLDSFDDVIACTYPPVCGFSCPRALVFLCSNGPMSLVIRDVGAVAAMGSPKCSGGGGYNLRLSLFDGTGNQLPVEFIRAIGNEQPSLNDEAVPGTFGVGPKTSSSKVP
ncbi:MAG: hypothetical protein IH936_13410 [Acidobacteria bacterium]|nr:hypothetical protein [Acidobacteriota bacterium]